MTVRKITIISCLLIMLAGPKVFAEAEVQKDNDDWGFLPIALPYYMPETSLGLGFSLLYFFKDSKKLIEKANEISLYGTVTMNKQFSAGLSVNMFVFEDILKTVGAVEYSYFPDLFWGLGDNSRSDAEEKFAGKTSHFKASLLAKVLPGFYLGPHIKLLHDAMKEKSQSGILIRNLITGSSGINISALGLEMNFDSRDNSFYPTGGAYLNLLGYISRKALGSEVNFYKVELDARCFFELAKEHIIGLQFYLEHAGYDEPFQVMARLGGDMMMRGYYQGRYRDKNYAAVQAEYRYPLYKRLSGVVFAGAAQVADKIDRFDLHFDALKYAGGLGLRFNVEEQEHINVRLDAGMDKDKNLNFYVMIKDAF